MDISLLNQLWIQTQILRAKDALVCAENRYLVYPAAPKVYTGTVDAWPLLEVSV